MPNLITDLIVDRVDLVDEGANSAAFIQLFKRRENVSSMTIEEILGQMKAEHAEVIKSKLAQDAEALDKAKQDLEAKNEEVTVANDELANAKEELEKKAKRVCKECGKEFGEDDEENDDMLCKACRVKKAGAAFDEAEVLKSAPKELAGYIATLKAKKDAAEEAVRKAAAEKAEAEAIAKAASFKNLPIEQSTLASVIKSADSAVVDLLSTIDSAIGATVLDEVGKSKGAVNNTDPDASWTKIESAAETIAKSKGISKQAAIARVIKEQPALYKEYLEGGAN